MTTPDLSEKFFRHLNNGEIWIDVSTLHSSGAYRVIVVIQEGEVK